MNFSFNSESAAIAKQNLPWGVVLIVFGVLLVLWSLNKDRAIMYQLGAVVLIVSGGWVGYQSHLLGQRPGKWEILADSYTIDWRSPNETVDKSFSLPLSEIEYILVEKDIHKPESHANYRIFANGSAFTLNKISGIDLQKFVEYLVSQGVQLQEIIHDPEK